MRRKKNDLKIFDYSGTLFARIGGTLFTSNDTTIENEDLWPFYLQTFGTYRFNSLNQKTISISLESLVFAQDGKIILEQGEWIFEYFEQNIRLQKNPLAKYVRIYIS